MKHCLSAVYASITTALFLGVAGCSSGEGVDPNPSSSPTLVTASADLKAVFRHWANLSGPQQNSVCEWALQTDGPDYKGMLEALVGTGLSQADAAATLPFAVNECL